MTRPGPRVASGIAWFSLGADWTVPWVLGDEVVQSGSTGKDGSWPLPYYLFQLSIPGLSANQADRSSAFIRSAARLVIGGGLVLAMFTLSPLLWISVSVGLLRLRASTAFATDPEDAYGGIEGVQASGNWGGCFRQSIGNCVRYGVR